MSETIKEPSEQVTASETVTAPATTTVSVPEPTPAPTTEAQAIPATTTEMTDTVTAAPPQPAAAPMAPTTAPAAEQSVETKTAATEDEEPQNTLTKRFTDREWTALRELRAQLPDILKEAYPDNSDAGTKPFALWGVEVDPQHPSKDARVSVVLMKFLRARNLNVGAARDMFVSTLRWRQSFDVEAAGKEEFPQDVFGNIGHNFGRDRDGRPVTYNLYGGNQDLKAVFGDVQRFIRWRVALMEKSIALLDFNEVDQLLQVHDYEGVSLSSRDANSKNAANEASNIFQSHYPEFLYKKFFVNVPTIFSWIFWAFKSFLSAATIAKMSVVGSGKSAIGKVLLPLIPAEQLPQRYGGSADAF